MAKNIALFSDGTGNSSAKLFKTNVWRVYEALDLSGPEQVAYYDDGVGTSSFKPFALLGGGLGLGLKRNVKHLYAFLSRAWEPDARIYAFGFSRGAFTIRILVGLVHDQGLALGATEAELWRDVNARWRAYRKRARTGVLGRARTKFLGRRQASPAPSDPRVRFTFLGLWDTVDAYGLPVDELTRAWDKYVWPLEMNDRRPSRSIGKAFHALSIDDERNTFHPVLWTETGGDGNATTRHLDEERISQVWFAGAHANVGGGYPDDALAHVSLEWIMSEADRRLLRFREGELARVRTLVAPYAPVNDSRRGFASYYRFNPRKIAELTNDYFHGVTIARPKIHATVFDRIRTGDDRYAPFIFPQRYAVVAADNSIADAERDAGSPLPPKGLLESVSQAKARGVRQERVWNVVWGRRITYFLTVGMSAALAAFPAYRPAAPGGTCLSDYFCFLSKPIGLASAVLPSFASTWIEAFQSHPGWFAVIGATAAALLVASAALARTIKDRMRLIWNPIVAAPMTEVPVPPAPSDWIYALRTSSGYRWFFRMLSRHAGPAFFAVLIYCAGLVLVSRVALTVAGAVGAGCTPSVAERPLAEPYTFRTNDPCAATGYHLAAGAHYRIWISIDDKDPWIDRTIPADVAGFSKRSLMPFTPFRRSMAQPWFKPIARIAATGNDEYPLDPSEPFATGAGRSVLAARIEARRDGELFLYVNDAVWLWPWWHTYANNHGSARVQIQRVEPRPAPVVTR